MVKLSENAIISTEKLSRYLLVKRPVGDKSAFLKRAGYTVDNWEQLERDLRQQILTKDATLLEQSVYGELFEIRASLEGPNGVALQTRTIWMRETESGLTKFVTLYPDKGRMP
jgi:hypothetical protein